MSIHFARLSPASGPFDKSSRGNCQSCLASQPRADKEESNACIFLPVVGTKLKEIDDGLNVMNVNPESGRRMIPRIPIETKMDVSAKKRQPCRVQQDADSVFGDVERLQRVVVLERLAEGRAALDANVVGADVQRLQRVVALERLGECRAALDVNLVVADAERLQRVVALESLGQCRAALVANLIATEIERLLRGVALE